MRIFLLLCVAVTALASVTHAEPIHMLVWDEQQDQQVIQILANACRWLPDQRLAFDHKGSGGNSYNGGKLKKLDLVASVLRSTYIDARVLCLEAKPNHVLS